MEEAEGHKAEKRRETIPKRPFGVKSVTGWKGKPGESSTNLQTKRDLGGKGKG